MLTEDEKRGLKTPLCHTPVSDLLQFAAQFLPTTMYQSTLSNASLFGMHSLPTKVTSAVSTLPHDDTIHTVESSYYSAASESVSDMPENEVTDKQDAPQPQLSTPISDAVSFNYPPMPATAQHVSEVQDRILRGSSVNEDLCSPIHADTVDADSAGETAVDPGMIVMRFAEFTPDVFLDMNDVQECLSDVGCCQAEKVAETPRSVMQRRSRIVARFAQRSDSAPDSS